MSRKFDFYKVKSRDIFIKSSKHVETCFVSANDDFGDKLTYIYCFLHENNFWTKIPQNGHCAGISFVNDSHPASLQDYRIIGN